MKEWEPFTNWNDFQNILLISKVRRVYTLFYFCGRNKGYKNVDMCLLFCLKKYKRTTSVTCVTLNSRNMLLFDISNKYNEINKRGNTQIWILTELDTESVLTTQRIYLKNNNAFWAQCFDTGSSVKNKNNCNEISDFS